MAIGLGNVTLGNFVLGLDYLRPLPLPRPVFVGGVWSAAVSIHRADRNNQRIDDLTPWFVGGSVDWDAERRVKGAARLTFRRAGLLSLGDCVRVDLRLEREDGMVRSGQVGLYVPTALPRAEHDTAWSEVSYELADLTELLRTGTFRSTYNVPVGTQITTAIADLYAGAGVSRYVLPSASTVTDKARSYRKGSDKLTGATALHKLLGFPSIGADLSGRIRAERRRLIRSTEPFATFLDADNLAVIREESGMERFGNVVAVEGDHPGGAKIVVVRINDDPDSPASTVSLGREWPLNGGKPIRDADITTADEAEERAEEALERAGSYERVVRLKILADPSIGINRSFDLRFSGDAADLSGRYWVRGWAMPLGGEVTMELVGNRVVRYRPARELLTA